MLEAPGSAVVVGSVVAVLELLGVSVDDEAADDVSVSSVVVSVVALLYWAWPRGEQARTPGQNAEAVEAIDAYRLQLNSRLADIERRLNNLAGPGAL